MAAVVVFGASRLGTGTLSSAPTPAASWTGSATAMPSVAGQRRPQGYTLPTECRYVDNGSVDRDATTWKIACPQGLTSSHLQPSLAAQDWVTCGTTPAKMLRKSGLQITIFDAVNVSGFSAWLDQRPLGGANCTLPPQPTGGPVGPP
jgi:hypothetical protein